MMIASSLSRGGIEVPNRTNAPTRWTRSHSSGLRRSALNGPRRPAPRGPDWMASATRFCSVVMVSAVSVVNRPSLIAMPPLLGRPLPPARVNCSGRRERHRQPFDTADEVRAELLRLRRGLDVRQPAEQLDEHRGDLSTRQVRAQAEVGAARPECALLVWRARDVEAVGVGEVFLVAVGGDVPHGDLLVPLHRYAGERRVAHDGPPHVHHRARPPDDLLDRRRAQPVEIGQPLALLVWELREGPHALTDGRARGLVAGGDQQEEERPEVLWRHRLAVDLGVHEHGRQVVLRMLEALLAEPEAVLAQLARRLQKRLARAPERLVAAGQETVGQVQQLRPVALRHPHHVADDGDGQRVGDLADELRLALRGDGVDDPPGALADRVFRLRDHLRGEAAVHHAPELGVLRGIGGDHRADGAHVLHVPGIDHHLDPVRGAERLPVTGGGGDVVVAGDRPEALAGVRVLVPGDRPLVPELGQRAFHVVAQPEVETGRVDLVERQGARGRGNGAHAGLLVAVDVEASVVYRIGYTLSRHTERRTACEWSWTERSARATPCARGWCRKSSWWTTTTSFRSSRRHRPRRCGSAWRTPCGAARSWRCRSWRTEARQQQELGSRWRSAV